jgi:hypothetical protein
MNRRIPDAGMRRLVSPGTEVSELISWVPR